VEKHVPAVQGWTGSESDIPNICFLGTSIRRTCVTTQASAILKQAEAGGEG